MQADDIYHLIASGADPDTCWTASSQYLENLGFDKIIHLKADSGGTAPEIRTTMPQSFQQFYGENGYAKDDPFLIYCLNSPKPIKTGQSYVGTYDYLTRRQKGLIGAAGDVGFNAGFSLVTRFPSVNRAEAWNLGSSLGQREVESLQATYFAEIRAVLFALSDRLVSKKPMNVLSAREIQCLELLSAGLRIKAIATELGIKPVTVDLHLSNARKKLNAPTTKFLLKKYWDAMTGSAIR